MNKHILKYGLTENCPWAFAEILNFFKIEPSWFLSPKVEPAELVKWAAKFYLGKHPRQTLTRDDKSKIVDKLKTAYNFNFSDIEKHEEKWRSRIEQSASYGYDYNVTEEMAIICPGCGDVANAEDFMNNKGNYHSCDWCDTVFRPKEEEVGDRAPYYWYETYSEMEYENTLQLLMNYVQHLRADFDGFWIEGRNLNWRGSSGHATVEMDAEELLSILSVDSDHTLTIEWMTDDTLRASCAHHDATSGYDVTPAHACDYSGEILNPEDNELHKKLAAVLVILEGYDYNYVSEDEYRHRVDYLGLPDPILELVEEIGTGITVTMAENLSKIIEGYEDEN